MFGMLAQLKDALTTMSNTNFYCTTMADVFSCIRALGGLKGAQFEDVGASLKLLRKQVIFLSFLLHVRLFSASFIMYNYIH